MLIINLISKKIAKIRVKRKFYRERRIANNPRKQYNHYMKKSDLLKRRAVN